MLQASARLLGQSFPLSLAAWFNKSFRTHTYGAPSTSELPGPVFYFTHALPLSLRHGELSLGAARADLTFYISPTRETHSLCARRPRFAAVVTCKLRFFKKSSRSLFPSASHLIKLRFIGAATLPGIKASGKSAVAGGKFGLMEKLFLRLNGIPTKKQKPALSQTYSISRPFFYTLLANIIFSAAIPPFVALATPICEWINSCVVRRLWEFTTEMVQENWDGVKWLVAY